MLWLLLSVAALAHPAADGHHVHGCTDVPGVFRYAQALTVEGRLDEALAAIDQARACGADPADTDLATGMAHLAGDRPTEAFAALDRAAKRRPDAPNLLGRAEALVALGRFDEAANDRLAALALVERPGPDLWLATAQALGEAGRLEEAVAIVDRGVADVGAVAGLVRYGVLLAEKSSPEVALQRLDRLPRTLPWLQLRGEILARAGRSSEAQAILQEALRLAKSDRQAAELQAAITSLRTR